jgi:hypothetical protein
MTCIKVFRIGSYATNTGIAFNIFHWRLMNRK